MSSSIESPASESTAGEPAWWDPYSDQPYRLPAAAKPRRSSANLTEYLRVAAAAGAGLPALCWRYLRLRPGPPPPSADFVGLGISPDPRYDDAVVEMVADLGVRQLLLRVPTWHRHRFEPYRRLLESYTDQQFLINILQSRDSIARPEQWRQDLREIFTLFDGRVQYYQIGNAINRSKWGCAHSGDYLMLLDIAEQVRGDFPAVRLVGSSVIDFEPLVTLRTLRNNHRYHLDVVSSLLYVNRRGSPAGRQYGVFDLRRKLRLINAMVQMGRRNAPRLWITEFNWPLLNTKPYTPNSGHPRSTVDEATQADYLREYYRIAHASGWVERVYWWQLISPGYGLVDHRGGQLRRHPAYAAFKELLHGGLPLGEALQAR